MYVSGEAGYYWLGTTDFLPGIYTDTPRHAPADLPIMALIGT
jgi:hypothetical protein